MSASNLSMRAFVRERIAIANSGVKILTASTYNDVTAAGPAPTQSGNQRRHARSAKITLDSGSGDIHYTEDGTDPTTPTDNTGVGSFATAGDVIWLESYEAITKFKAKALTATAAQGEVVYYR